MKFLGKIGFRGMLHLSREFFAFMALILALGLALAAPAQAGTWTVTGSRSTAGGGDTILLPNGKVLAAGGFGGSGEGNVLSICELYNPATGLWSGTGSLAEARAEFPLVRLADGRVLAVGGMGSSGELRSAEIYNPTTGLWGSAGSLATARAFHSATLLPNGKVLVAGGSYDAGNSNWVTLSSAELYDPGTNQWSSTDSLKTARNAPSAIRLLNGKVLVAGGGMGAPTWLRLSSCELYDPDTGHWSDTGSFNYARASERAITRLPNGKVLLAGGWGDSGPLSSCQVYDPGTGLWSDTGSLITARQEQPAVLLPNGEVLTFGGYGSGDNKLASAELYNPSTGRWRTTGSLHTATAGPSATLMPNGKVLTAGGRAEFYTPGESLPSVTMMLLEENRGNQ